MPPRASNSSERRDQRSRGEVGRGAKAGGACSAWRPGGVRGNRLRGDPRLFGIAHRILRDYHRAEDATQRAIVQIWRELPRLTDADKFDGWAYRLGVNACYAETRAERRGREAFHVRVTDHTVGDSQTRVADRDMLERAFRRLPAEQRAVLVLQYYLDLGHGEIAEMLGIPLGTVKSRASGGRSALRAALEADARPGIARGIA